MTTSLKSIHTSPRHWPRCLKWRPSSRCYKQKADLEPCVHVERKMGHGCALTKPIYTTVTTTTRSRLSAPRARCSLSFPQRGEMESSTTNSLVGRVMLTTPLIKASAQLGNTRTHVFVRIRVTSIPRPLKCRPTGSVAEKLAITMGVILRSDRKYTCT